MTTNDSSVKPIDETIFRPLDSEDVLDWLLRYDASLVKGPTDHVPVGTTVEALAPEFHRPVEELRECLHLLEELRDSARDTDHEPHTGFHEALGHWLLTGKQGALDLSSRNVFVGRYRLIKEVGRGGHGVVFLAEDPFLGRNVAIKLPLPEILLADGARRRFTSEGWAVASLDHPHVLRVYDAGDDGPISYIVSEYCTGPTLQSWIARRGDAIPSRLAASIVANLADAVGHAHSRGILHRDLKPGNVLLQYLDERDEFAARVSGANRAVAAGEHPSEFPFTVKLADFGIAKCFDEVAGKTATGLIVGTGSYMAPEQANASLKELGPTTDVYGLGAILYQMLSGRQVFEEESLAAMLKKILTDEPVPIRKIRPDIPRDLEAVCLKCLEKKPGDRYSRAGELAAELRRFLNGESVLVRPEGIIGRLRKVHRRQSRSMKVLLGLLLLSWAVALALMFVRFPESSNESYPPLHAFDYFDDICKANQLWQDSAERRDDNPRVALEIEKLLKRHIPEPGAPDHRTGAWHYLWRLVHPEQFVEPLTQVHSMLAHAGNAYFVVFSHDGKRLATAGADGTAKIFDVDSGKLLKTLSGHVGGVNWVELAPDGRPMAATAGEDGTIRLWDTNTGQEIWKFGDSKTEVVGAAFSPSEPLLATADAKGVLTVWNIDSKKPIRYVNAHDDRITSLAWSTDGTKIVTTCEIARIWNASTLQIFGTHSSPRPESAVFSPDGETLAATGGMRAIYLDDVRLGNRRAGWEGFKDKFQSVRFSSDGRSLVAVGDDPDSILFCDLATRHCWNASPGPHGSLWCVAVSPDGIHYATTGRDGRLIVYKQSTGAQWTIQTTPGDRPLQFSIAADSSLAVGVFSDHPNDRDVRDVAPFPSKDDKVPTTLRVWDLSQASPSVRFDFAEDRIGSFALSNDSKSLVIGAKEQIIQVDPDSGKEVSRVPFAGLGRFRRLAWLANEKSLAAVSSVEDGATSPNAKLFILNLDEKSSRQIAEGALHDLGTSAVSRDGKFIAILLQNRIDLYDAVAQSVIAQAPYAGDDVASLEFSPDGASLAVGMSDGEVHFWDFHSNRDALVWSTHTGHAINDVHFLGQGRLVAVHSIRGRFIRIWSLDRQETIISLPLPATMSAGIKFPTEVGYPLWQREPFKFDSSASGSILAMVELANEKQRERRTVYFWDRRPETASQVTPRVRPAFVARDGKGAWMP